MGKNGPKLKPVAADAPRAQSIEQLTGMLSGDSTGRWWRSGGNLRVHDELAEPRWQPGRV